MRYKVWSTRLINHQSNNFHIVIFIFITHRHKSLKNPFFIRMKTKKVMYTFLWLFRLSLLLYNILYVKFIISFKSAHLTGRFCVLLPKKREWLVQIDSFTFFKAITLSIIFLWIEVWVIGVCYIAHFIIMKMEMIK